MMRSGILGHQVERLLAPDVEPHQEVGHVAPRDSANEIRDFEAQRLILGIGKDAGMVLEHLCEFFFPGGVEHDVADVASGRTGTGRPARLGGVEVDTVRDSVYKNLDRRAKHPPWLIRRSFVGPLHKSSTLE